MRSRAVELAGACSSASKRSGDDSGVVAEGVYWESAVAVTVAGRRRLVRPGSSPRDMPVPVPVRWLPPKLVLPSCVAIAALSYYLAGARAVEGERLLQYFTQQWTGDACDGGGGAYRRAEKPAATEMAQPARCTTVFIIRPKGNIVSSRHISAKLKSKMEKMANNGPPGQPNSQDMGCGT
uniref:Uncharacterized protein n=1 Tax=Oryza glumipatula TaxID=40148 RepID=A0A0D9ZHX2_9ORYZ